jgi:hypothetical protein
MSRVRQKLRALGSAPSVPWSLGQARLRTPAQLAIAQFWNLRVAGYQNELASNLIVSHRRSERDAAHILALANMPASTQ